MSLLKRKSGGNQMNLLKRSNSLLNMFGENMTIFTVAKNENIQEDDFVVVNTRTLQAYKPKKESGYYSVGRATRIIQTENGGRLVICRDGLFKCNNSSICIHKIVENNIDRVCYFEDDTSVSLDNINSTKAGTIINVSSDGIIIKIDVTEGGGMQW